MEISQVIIPDQVVDGVGVAVDLVAGVVAEVLIAELTHYPVADSLDGLLLMCGTLWIVSAGDPLIYKY